MLSELSVAIPSSLLIRKNLECILQQARNAKPLPLIVHVRNTGGVGDSDEPNTPGWQLIFPPESQELVVDKMKNSAFVGTCLANIIPNDVEIVVAGFHSDYSVRDTCLAALARGNEVLLIRGGHATRNRIEVLHGGGIIPAHRIQTEVEQEMEDAGVHVLDMKDLSGIFTNR